jgi:HPt (histidine-containing phosphotransfer) domain-containing protein
MQTTSVERDLSKLPVDLREIFDNFLTQLKPSISDLQSALDNHDWKTLRSKVHRLRGSAAMLGYKDLTRVLGEMEEMIDPSKDNDEEKLGDAIKILPDSMNLDWSVVEDYIYVFSLN